LARTSADPFRARLAPGVSVGFSKETRAFKRLIWLAVAFAALGVGAIALTIFSLRDDTIEQAAREQSDLAIVVAREMVASNHEVEHVLDRMEAIVAKAAPTSAADFRAMLSDEATHQALKRLTAKRPEIDVASLIAENGDIVNFTRSWPAASINDGHKDDFVQLSSHLHSGTFIGRPEFSAAGHDWLIYFGRRVETADGRFLGVAHVGVKVSFYGTIYAGIAALKDKTIVLRRTDGVLLASYPVSDQSGVAILYGSPWLRLAAKGGGAFVGEDFPGGAKQLVAVQPMTGYPVIVDVDETLKSVLARWRVRSAQIGFGALLALVCAAALARAAYRHFQSLLRSEASLAERGLDLAIVNARFAAVLDNMPHGVALFDGEKRVTVVNRRYGEMYGLTAQDVQPGTLLQDIVRKRVEKGAFVADAQSYLERRLHEAEVTSPSHRLERFANGMVVSALRRPLGEGAVLTIHEDVTARQRAEDRIEQMAWRDQLTGLANRALLLNEMSAWLAPEGPEPTPLALLLVDLDDFKGVNDTHGHPFGDALLRAVADRLKEAAGETAIVARIGGDEFALLQAHGQNDAATTDLAERMLAAIRRPFVIEDCQLSIRPSVGVACSPRDGEDVEALFKAADLALYAAKAGGRDRIGYYEPRLEQGLRESRALKADLSEAIARGELEVHFQPIVEARSRRILEMEALARWRHPTRGMISPDVFIRLAEESGLIHAVGKFVLARACESAKGWPDEIGVSVNLSPAQLARGDFLDVLQEALGKSGLAPQRLTLEITETVLMENLERGNEVIKQARALGARVALDDFGTGFSSLSYLQTFALDTVKIDRTFIAAMETNPRTREIVPLIAAIARNLGFRTVAEGVETQSQLDLVIAAGCQAAQGYYFSRPLPASEFDFSAGALAERAA
jgi:diguanylate cyclase (GGDEF)-like protein/PAS domain S-box-containing protein